MLLKYGVGWGDYDGGTQDDRNHSVRRRNYDGETQDESSRYFNEKGELITEEGALKNARTDVDKTVEKAQKQHDEYIQKLLEGLELEEGQTIEFPYLVRGAKLCCSCGTHKRKMNLCLCHGVYASGQPMVQEEDCLVGDGQNITAFGICQSSGHPSKKPWWVKAATIFMNCLVPNAPQEESEKIILETVDDEGNVTGNVKGYACTPCIVGNWKDVHKTQKIARNNTDGTAEEDKLSAITLESFLVCAYGGLIQPVDSGQDAEAPKKQGQEGTQGS